MPDDYRPPMPRRNPEDIAHGATKTDLGFLVERVSRLPVRQELALRPLYIIAGSAGPVIAWVDQPEDVIAYSWRESVLPPSRLQHPWTSTQGEMFLSVSSLKFRPHLARSMQKVSVARPPLPPACDRAQAPSPRSSGARNMLEPSGDDCSVTPTAGGIHLRSSRVARLYAELMSFPGSRNQDKSHGPDGRNGAPTQRE